MLLSLVDIDVDRLVERLGAERGTIYLVDLVEGEVCSCAAHLPEIKEIRLPLGRGVAGHVAQTGQPVLLNDVGEDSRFFSGIDQVTGYTTRTMLAAPLCDDQGQVRGVVQVINSKQGRFTLADQQVICSITAEIASTIRWTQNGGPCAALPSGQAIIGRSPCMLELYDCIQAAAGTDASVLLRGESGTGKTLIARALHEQSRRREGPMVHVDCTTLPAGLIESELFGHERGAFTGADRQVQGKFELAHGGTLFLDEIGDLPLPLQGKLLRFLQDHQFERVGGRRTLRADVRVITATNADLEQRVEVGAFRRDLYYRVRVVELVIPPLRERGCQDVQRLTHFFIERFARRYRREVRAIEIAAMQHLQAYGWPGNVRELEHCIESAVVLCSSERIEDRHLALPGGARAVPGRWAGYPPGMPLRAVIQDHVRQTLEHCGGNRSEAARQLKIGRNTLLRRLRS